MALKNISPTNIVDLSKLIFANNNANRPSNYYFSGNLDLAFPLEELKIKSKNSAFYIDFSLFNLVGYNTLLPDHLTEYVSSLKNSKENALFDFLNIFLDIIAKLYLKTLLLSQYYLFINNEQTESIINHYSRFINLSFSKSLTNVKTFYAGLNIQKYKSKHDLCLLLIDYFQLPFSIKSHIGQWMPVEIERFNKLGFNAILGNRIWYMQSHFEIIIGPVNLKIFMDLLPNKPLYELINSLVKGFIGPEYTFNIKVLLKANETPPLQLNHPGKNNFTQVNLGWNTWLCK